MRDQTQAWSDRPEPVREGVPEQRQPTDDSAETGAAAEAEAAAETGAAAPWAPPPERVASGDGSQSPWAGAPGEDRADEARAEEARADEDRADEDRAVGVASVPETPDDARGEEARVEEARVEEARDDEAALAAEEHEPHLVDNGDDDRGAVYRSDAEDRDIEDRDIEDRDIEAGDREAGDREAGELAAGEASGGVPVDAVSAADAPVPAAAYETEAPRDAEESPAAEQPGEAGTTGPADELMPGDVPEEPVNALFDDARATEFRDRWQRVQMQFVDDPRSAADQARTLVDDVFTAMHEALTSQRGSLDSWQSGASSDTEQLRVAVRRYRDFLDRMLGL
jgi:hypothetical protein